MNLKLIVPTISLTIMLIIGVSIPSPTQPSQPTPPTTPMPPTSPPPLPTPAPTPTPIPAQIFDTGSPSNPYPSIFGTHSGTIAPNKTIIATKLYTYPCAGTGGHTEYARIWNKTWNATATWDGYAGDRHNITFDNPVVLLPNETYNYTIRTGSYPQIHHNTSLLTPNGWINCTKFIDTNGKIYYDWIPAIRLE